MGKRRARDVWEFDSIAEFPSAAEYGVGLIKDSSTGFEYWCNGSIIKKESGVIASAKVTDPISIRAIDNVPRQSPFDQGSIYVAGGLL
ncbi:MAG: hypothetical protein U1D69_10835 [Polynucleobacter sp.]|nr:hypothetical protein [Polynucleobacter sp.]